jgi:hypothetical protein
LLFFFAIKMSPPSRLTYLCSIWLINRLMPGYNPPI